MTTRTCSVPSHAAAMKGHGAAHLQQGGAKTEARQHVARRLALRVERAAGGIRAARNVAGNSEVGGICGTQVLRKLLNGRGGGEEVIPDCCFGVGGKMEGQ